MAGAFSSAFSSAFDIGAGSPTTSVAVFAYNYQEHSTMYLRQSTASQEIKLGPFVDDTDGKTPETGLTIANTDIKITKGGSTSEVNKNSGGATHVASGRYSAVLDATDTDTVGILEIDVHVSGALPVRRQFYVLEEAVFDAIMAASSAGYQVPIWSSASATVNLSGTTISTSQAVASVSGNVGGNVAGSVGSISGVSFPSNFSSLSITGAGGVNVNGDLFGSTLVISNLATASQIGTAGAGLTAIPWNAAWDAEVQSECADALNAYDPPTNAEMEARTLTSASYGTSANQTTILARLGSWTGSGINTVLGAFRALMAKASALTPTDISSSTTYDNTTDSLEALRDRGDAAWTTGSGGGGSSQAVIGSTNAITRNINEELPIQFTWNSASATITGTVEIGTASAVALQGAITFVRTDAAGKHWYQLAYDADDRPTVAGLARYVFTDGTSYLTVPVQFTEVASGGGSSTPGSVAQDTADYIYITRNDSYDGTANAVKSFTVSKNYTGWTGTFTVRHRITGASLCTASVTVVSSTLLTVSLSSTATAFALLVDDTEFGPHPFDIEMVNGASKKQAAAGVAIVRKDVTYA